MDNYGDPSGSNSGAPQNTTHSLETLTQLVVSLSHTVNTLVSQNSGATPQPIPSAPTTSTANKRRVRPASPADFDGVRENGRTFLNSCTLYLSLAAQEFADDTERIHWAFTFMKKGRAAEQVNRWLQQEAKSGLPCFADWGRFVKAFEELFCPVNEQENAVITLESDNYHQGRRTVEEYTDRFKDLIHRSGYSDDIVITVKYRRVKDSDVTLAT